VSGLPAIPTIVVSGLPRSGTSAAMQCLAAGGVEPVTDGLRPPDADNPRGYLELEAVKRLKSDKAWLDGAAGKAVKVIHLLLPELPDDRAYRVIFLRRDLGEVVRSQAAMLERGGKRPALPADRLVAMYEAQLRQVDAWLAARPNFVRLDVEHARLVRETVPTVAAIADFVEAGLGRPLDRAAMAAAVDPSLHRNRS
jgi:hypothetical protein